MGGGAYLVGVAHSLLAAEPGGGSCMPHDIPRCGLPCARRLVADRDHVSPGWFEKHGMGESGRRRVCMGCRSAP